MTERDAMLYVKANKSGKKQELKEIIGPELYQRLRSADIIKSDDFFWYLTAYGQEVLP